MRIAFFCHSLVSDWQHGGSHFLRGVAAELMRRGHDVRVFEPADAWSMTPPTDMLPSAGLTALRRTYPGLDCTRYAPGAPCLEAALAGTDLVLVHARTDPAIVAHLGALRARTPGIRLLYHDTTHTSVSEPELMERLALDRFDAVLAAGEALRQAHLARGWAPRAYTWHEAADPQVFHPVPDVPPKADLVWIGDFDHPHRAEDLTRWFLEPARAIGARATVYGMHGPGGARLVEAHGATFGGPLPNHEVSLAHAAHRATVYVPARHHRTVLGDIPTVRVYEALASGIPLVCAAWRDTESLFQPGEDFLVARDADEMQRQLQAVLTDTGLAARMGERGQATIAARHTLRHRVDDLLRIARELGLADVPQHQPYTSRPLFRPSVPA